MKTAGVCTRRAFLKATAGAVGAPLVIPASAIGGDGRPSPAERITMGFIGVGGQGGGHLYGGAWTYLPGGYVARDDVQVLAVCDVRRDRRELGVNRVNEHYSRKNPSGAYVSARGYVDFREVLARPDIDAVLIATPIYWHGIMTIMAARAGKDIYCEKPTACFIGESKAARDAVKRYARVFQGGTQQRSEYGGKFRWACELVRSGRIGTLRSVYACINGGGVQFERWFGPGKPVPDGLDWDLYLGPAPWSPYNGQAHAHMFGTGGINWGQHHYDVVQWAIAGADETGPVEIWFEQGRPMYRYANGVVVYGCHYPDPSIGLGGKVHFAGEGGCVYVGTDGIIAVDRQQIIANPPDILKKPLGPDDARVYFSQSHSGNFLECVRTRKRTICDIESSHRAASLMLLGWIAECLRRRLKWDPVAERFENDDQANRMLSTTFRPPWNVV